MPLHQGFRLGRFEVLPAFGTVRGPAGERSVHPHAMEVLLLLAQNAGKLVTRRQIMHAVWGNNPVTQDTLTRNVAELRQVLEDDPQHPSFIQTVPRRGYRLVASVRALNEDPPPAPDQPDRLPHPVQQWLAELFRRSVFKNLAIYAVLSWTCVEVADLVLPYLLQEPSRVMAALLALVATGYPVTALLSWVLEVTEHGVVVDARATRWRRLEARQVMVVLGVVVALVAGLLTYWAASPPFVDGRVRLAVLPLDNLGPEEKRPFCDGLTEELTYTLSRIPVLKVAARKSAQALSGDILPVSEIGSRLNVSHVLEGSCQYDADKLKVTAQLIDTETGFHAWSQAYVVAPTSIFDIQQDIARQVARALRVLLSQDTERRLSEAEHSDDSEAYSLYLQAKGYLRMARQAENLQRAQALFEAAIERDPAYGAAHAGLCETFLAWYELERAAGRFAQAEESCAQAMARTRDGVEVQLALAELARYAGNYPAALNRFLRVADRDPTLADAYVGQARSLAAMKRPEEAEAAFRVAIAEDPVYWVSINAYGAFLYQQGRYDEAVTQFARVARLDPGNASAFNNLGGARFMAGDFAAAGQAYERSIAIAPKAAAMSNSGTMYFYAGDFARAEQLYRRALAVTPEDYRVWGSLGDALLAQAGETGGGDGPGAEWADAYRRAAELARAQLAVNERDHMARASLAHYLSRLGQVEEAEDQLRRAVAAAPADMDVRYNQALVMVRLGRGQEALQALREALRAGYQPALLRADPGLAALRGLPEFEEMIKRP